MHNYSDTYNTFIIAYCPDTDSFFVTNQRAFFYEFSLDFYNEEDGIDFFTKHIFEFIAIRNQIMRTAGQKETNKVYLENTKNHYISH